MPNGMLTYMNIRNCLQVVLIFLNFVINLESNIFNIRMPENNWLVDYKSQVHAVNVGSNHPKFELVLLC